MGQGVGALGKLALHDIELGDGPVGLGIGAAGEGVLGDDLGQDRPQPTLPGSPALPDLADLTAAGVGVEAVQGGDPAGLEGELVQALAGERRGRAEVVDLDGRQVPAVDPERR